MLVRTRDAPPRMHVPPAVSNNQFVGQLDHLSECVLSGKEPIVPGEEGVRDMVLIDAIYRSVREGRAIRMDARNEPARSGRRQAQY